MTCLVLGTRGTGYLLVLVRVALLVFKDERLDLSVEPSAGHLCGEIPSPCQTALKIKSPRSLSAHRSSLVGKAQTCLVFKFTFRCEHGFPHSRVSAFPHFFPLRPAHHFTGINSCCFILWLLLPLIINACMNNFDSSFTFDESVPGLL